MASFNFVVVDQNNQTKTGTIEHIGKDEALETLKAQGLRPISIKETNSKPLKLDSNLFVSKKIKSTQLVIITRQLSAMISAGVPLLRALNALALHSPEKSFLRVMLTDIIKDIESGSSLSQALGKYPASFNSVYTNMVKAGETAGILDDILKRLAQEQEKSSSIRKKIRGSMAYPIVLLLITVIAFFGLMLFVVPQIGQVIKDLGGEGTKLPGLTLFMLSVSNFITSYWFIIIPGLILLLILTIAYIKSSSGRKKFDSLILHIPVIKTVVTKISVAHFARTFSALTEAGVAVLEALSVTSKAVGNYVYEKALFDAGEKVKNGAILSRVIAENKLFPPIVSQMLSVGEETGKTDEILVKVADFYEEEVDTTINSLSTIIEPVMIVIMGSLVGLIAASVVLPIAGMAQTIQ